MQCYEIILEDVFPQKEQVNQLEHPAELIWTRFGVYWKASGCHMELTLSFWPFICNTFPEW